MDSYEYDGYTVLLSAWTPMVTLSKRSLGKGPCPSALFWKQECA